MYGSTDNQNHQQNNPQYNYQNQPDHDYEDQQQYFKEEQEGVGLLGKSRMGFIRKVYLILGSMLFMTFGMTLITYFSESFRVFQFENAWLYYTLLVAAFVIQIAVFCFNGVATKVPTNYILCYGFAFCFSYMVSAICGTFFQFDRDGQQVVLIAAGMTFAITVALTIYAMTTKTDFTLCGGFLFIACMTLLMFGLFFWIFGTNQVLNTIYCCFGVLLYGLYLIYDTQLIMGGKRFELDLDHYILGAMMLFIDIIGMFLYLLQLLSRN